MLYPHYLIENSASDEQYCRLDFCVAI